ncbi:histone-lysine N-methyltransferase ASHR1-like [Brachionus plicatilis]|uniref:Histone-lysine N-methyltransferase ASHR1-like n=1 Tax=Brachionus plicatilis TaxID=10195 RepID=A0A3M7SBL7_BRAPC|nr:histone-lysine N-methyltransferase ASHR1-like [Brachionus plicatilis]
MSEDERIYLPYVYCLIFERKKKFCDFCFNELSKVCSCPICDCMHYCNRICEKNDEVHKFECHYYSHVIKKFDIKFLMDDIFILFLRTLIRTKKINDFNSQFFLDLDSSSQQKGYELLAIKYIGEVSKLIGSGFTELFNQNELISYFDKMMANKIEIKFRNETIGLGIYLEKAFDDSDMSNAVISFEGLKIICQKGIFPALSFPESATDSCYLKTSIRIANKFLKSRSVREFYRTKIKLSDEFLHEKMSQVKIVLKNINNLKDSLNQKETEIITVFIGFIIVHEFAHLLYRWNGNFHSPDCIEAGNSLEKLIFDGHTRAIISPKSKWNENSKFLGIAVDPLSRFQGLKHMSYNDYIKKIYDNTLQLKLYLKPKFENKPDEENTRAIKQCDENHMNESESIEQSSDFNDMEQFNLINK